jgi:hypothetical protein
VRLLSLSGYEELTPARWPGYPNIVSLSSSTEQNEALSAADRFVTIPTSFAGIKPCLLSCFPLEGHGDFTILHQAME